MENPLLTKFQALLACIRGIGNEKPSIREENMQKLPSESLFLIEDLIKAKSEDPLTIELLASLRDFLRLCFESLRWEDRFAGLFALEHINSKGGLIDFSLENLNLILGLLEEKETRLRSQASQFLGNLCKNLGFMKFFPLIFEKIMAKCQEEAEKPTGRVLEANLAVFSLAFSCLNEEICLESPVFFRIIDLISKMLMHPMKHIRVLVLDILEKLLLSQPLKDFIEDSDFMEKLVLWLEIALADNFTEPRFQGTKTAGFFLLRLKKFGFKRLEDIAKRLLPRICFNRLHPAESFGKKSQDIWMDFVKPNGRQILGSLIAEYIEYNLMEIKEKNWEIRETACRAFQELIGKVIVDNKEAAEKLMKKKAEILVKLIEATGDQYQSVRESAYNALIVGLNEVFEGSTNEICEGIYENIGESYPEIRKQIIELLGILCEKEGKGDLVLRTLGVLEKKIMSHHHEDHGHQSHEHGHEKAHEKSHEHDNKHENEHSHSECKENEEPQHKKHEHEGDIYDVLVGFYKEIARIFAKAKPEVVEKCIGMVLTLQGALKQEKVVYIKENIWKNMADGMVNSGKNIAKKHLDEFLSLAFEELENKENKEKNAVKAFVKKMQSFIGPNILKGRVEALAQGKWVKLYSEI